MPSLRAFYPTLRLAVACLILAVGLRTWLVMGLIEPVTVSGSSMVPTLKGMSVSPECPACGYRYCVGAEFATGVEQMTCPSCMIAKVPLEGLALEHGDRMWVDRLSFRWRDPKRWETVVARNPQNAAELCVKRVVGLPGDQVDLRDGDVRIDGAVFVKSTEEQRLVRQLIHRQLANQRGSAIHRWQPDKPGNWDLSGNRWHHPSSNKAVTDWLRYHHPQGQPITDDVPYNAGLTRRLNNTDELMLSVDVQAHGVGSIEFALDDGRATANFRIRMPTGIVEFTESGRSTSKLQLAEEIIARLLSGQVAVELSNFDQQLLLLIDGEVAVRRNWPRGSANGVSSPVMIGASQAGLTLENLTIYRDIYHSSHPIGTAGSSEVRWLLGPGEYFLLGDNSPVSIDSRLWGPVPARLIVGRPF